MQDSTYCYRKAYLIDTLEIDCEISIGQASAQREGTLLKACLWHSGHFVCASNEVDADIVLLLSCLVLEAELGIGGDDSDLAEILQDLGAVVLPVSQDSHCQLGSLKIFQVTLFAHQMDVGLISAKNGLA